ncbi:hypothetical protein COO60DRAFT_1457171 [Scenedesmus sp. NREL 46B-D3]|nr:hypothetical protein COO60DRAFT_1457171 [Scenedesmus sp. NREL 46B-D3]
MQRQANIRTKALDSKVTKAMALEAAAMEARLAELKLSMLQERARREAAMSAATAGAFASALPAIDVRVDNAATDTKTKVEIDPAIAELAELSMQETSVDEPSSAPDSSDWLTSMQERLQVAETAAAALASAAINPAAAKLANERSGLCSGTSVNQPAATTSTAVAAYQQQLRMLEELELLEQQ